jgi:hypothetical protein
MVEDPSYHLLAKQENKGVDPSPWRQLIEFYPALSLLRYTIYPILPGGFYPFYVLHLNQRC